MQKITLVLTNKMGLHARPASELIRTANLYKSDIKISGNNKMANAKSIIQVLTLGLVKDDSITIEVNGDDERDCIATLTRLIKNNFYEP